MDEKTTNPGTVENNSTPDEGMVEVFVPLEEGAISKTKTLRLGGEKCVLVKGEYNKVPRKFANLLKEKAKIKKLATKHLEKHDASKALKKI